jgi:hypothetical protein
MKFIYIYIYAYIYIYIYIYIYMHIIYITLYYYYSVYSIIVRREIVQKSAHIIDAIRSLDIYALSWVEHNLKECKKRFKKVYARKVQYIKFAIKK